MASDVYSNHHQSFGALLQLPPPLEQQFWDDVNTRSILCCIDVAACCLPFVNVAMVAVRRLRDVPDEVDIPAGAKLMLLGYLVMHMLMLCLLVTRPAAYWRRRVSLIATARFWRLASTLLWTHPQTVIGYGTQTAAVGKAALSGHISRALSISIFVPTAMHLQHTNLHLPFKVLLPFQLGNFVVAVVWAQGLPCWLAAPDAGGVKQHSCPQHLFGANLLAAAHTTSSSSGSACAVSAAALGAAAALQQAAEQACSKLQLLQLLLSSSIPPGGGLSALGPAQQLCKGPGAFQVLYLYVAALLLLVLPLTAYYLLERAAKSRWLKSKGIAVVGSSEGPGVQGSPPGHTTVQVGWLWGHHLPVLVLLLVQLPWAVSQVLAGWMHGQCAPPLGGPSFRWMSGLW